MIAMVGLEKYKIKQFDSLDLPASPRLPLDESAKFLNDKLNVDCFKIASVDLVNLPLIKYVSSFGKPIILSCGMSNLAEIEDALDSVISTNNKNVILLHCNSSYPAPNEDLNLTCIKTLKDRYKCEVGYSGHEFGLTTSISSIFPNSNP